MKLLPVPAARPNPFTTRYESTDIVERETETPATPVVEAAEENITIKAAVARFTRECSELVSNDYKRFTSLVEAGFSRQVLVEFGRRYAKLISMDVKDGETSAHSVFCFVDLTTGGILKAATWKSPAKHARGNVLRSDRLSTVTAYGAIYMR